MSGNSLISKMKERKGKKEDELAIEFSKPCPSITNPLLKPLQFPIRRTEASLPSKCRPQPILTLPLTKPVPLHIDT